MARHVATSILVVILGLIGPRLDEAQAQKGGYVPDPLEDVMLRQYRRLVRQEWKGDPLRGERKTQLKEITRLLVQEIYRRKQLRYLLEYEDPRKGLYLYAGAKLRDQTHLLRLDLRNTSGSSPLESSN